MAKNNRCNSYMYIKKSYYFEMKTISFFANQLIPTETYSREMYLSKISMQHFLKNLPKSWDYVFVPVVSN